MIRAEPVARAFCRRCGDESTFFLAGSENGTGPQVNYYRCRVCSFQRIEMGGVPDIEGLCRSVLDANLRRTGNEAESIPYDDALAHLLLKAYASYRKFDPTRGVPFLSYATAMVRHGLSDWYRREYGWSKDEPKAHVGAVSFDRFFSLGDDGSLEALVSAGASHPQESCSPDLERVLALRGGDDAREEQRMGIGPEARATAGASADHRAGTGARP